MPSANGMPASSRTPRLTIASIPLASMICRTSGAAPRPMCTCASMIGMDVILHAMDLELRQVVRVDGEQLVCHLADLGKREHRGSQRVVADCAIDRNGIAGQGRLDGKLLDAAG